MILSSGGISLGNSKVFILEGETVGTVFVLLEVGRVFSVATFVLSSGELRHAEKNKQIKARVDIILYLDLINIDLITPNSDRVINNILALQIKKWAYQISADKIFKYIDNFIRLFYIPLR
tara:strand:- start:5315 stop:5674 length:360 start_codon:yes stop_codon:yes gene_type:complete